MKYINHKKSLSLILHPVKFSYMLWNDILKNAVSNLFGFFCNAKFSNFFNICHCKYSRNKEKNLEIWIMFFKKLIKYDIKIFRWKRVIKMQFLKIQEDTPNRSFETEAASSNYIYIHIYTIYTHTYETYMDLIYMGSRKIHDLSKLGAWRP